MTARTDKAWAYAPTRSHGRLARRSGRQNRLGHLDLAADTIYGAGVLIGSVAVDVIPVWFGVAALLVFGGLVTTGSIAAGMALQLSGFGPLLIELWELRPAIWWTPFLVALAALVLDWRRLIEVNIPAFLRGVTGRFENRRRPHTP